MQNAFLRRGPYLIAEFCPTPRTVLMKSTCSMKRFQMKYEAVLLLIGTTSLNPLENLCFFAY